MERRVSGVSLDTLIEPQIKEKKENRKENRKPEETGEKKEIVLGDFTIERDRTEETEEQDMFSDTRQKPYQEFQEEPEEEFIEIPLSEEENFTRIPVEGEPEKHMKNPHSSRKEQEEGIKAVAQEIEETARTAIWKPTTARSEWISALMKGRGLILSLLSMRVRQFGIWKNGGFRQRTSGYGGKAAKYAAQFWRGGQRDKCKLRPYGYEV